MEILKLGKEVPERFNRSWQEDGFSCALYVLHYWEVCVREFLGEGWPLDRPGKTRITQIRSRRSQQIKVLRSTEESDAADFAKKGKSKEWNQITK